MRDIDRRIIGLAIPALGALAVEPVYVLVDTAVVGRLGTPQLAGLAVAATVLSLVFAGSNFLTYGATERVARRIGAGDASGAADVGVQALWLAVIVGVPAAIVLGVGAGPIAAAFGADGEVLEHATTYLRISAVGVPFFLVTLAAQGVLRGGSEYLSPLWILAAANLANLVIELLFVFVLDLGVAGSAWSTVIAQVWAACAFAGLMRSRLAAATTRRPDRAAMAPLATAGSHLLLRVGAMLAVIAGSTAVAARVDQETLAAHQIAMSMFTFLALSLDALAIPAQTLVAEETGRGRGDVASVIADRCVRLSIFAGLALGGAVALSAPWLPRLFTSDAAVGDRATTALWWLAAIMVPGAIAFAYDGVLIGLADYRFLGRAALAYVAIVAPIGLIVAARPELGISAIWFGLLVWMVLRATANDHRARRVLTIA